MERFFYLCSTLCIILFEITSMQVAAQVAGDFQTKNATGNWSDFNSWNIRAGGVWTSASAGQLPTATSSVYVQANQSITVDGANPVCNDLNVNGSATSKLSFSLSTSVLNVKGNMNLFNTSQNCFGIWAAGAKIVFSGTVTQSFTNLSGNSVFVNIEVNKGSGILTTPSNSMTISNSLILTAGTLNIDVSGTLTLNGAALVRTSGYIDGTNTSDISISGVTGGTVLLPIAGNISLRNISVSGTRILQMNGTSNINLNGMLDIASGASYDNGGESQLINGSSPSINISGTFINRDKDNFTGTNGAIPSIVPILNIGCTVDYALAGDQNVTSRNDYQNINFSGSGFKTLASGFNPKGTATISGSAVVDAGSFTFGDLNTNLTMTGSSKLITGGTGTKPDAGGVYTLNTGTTTEFNNNNATLESIRITLPTYYNVIVSGTGVGTTSAGGPIKFKSGGSFTVRGGGTFKLKNTNGFSGGTNTAIGNNNNPAIILEDGSAIDYNGASQTITNQLPYSNLLLSGSGNKTAPSDTLTVNGNLSNKNLSVFIHNNGTVLFSNATSPQNFSSTTGFTFFNLKNNNTGGGLSIKNSMSIEGALALATSSKLILDSNVTLRSTAAATASVSEIQGTATINYGAGLFVVERYFTPKRAWRFLSVPTNTTQAIKDAWQEGALFTTDNPVPGYGTQITDKVIPDAINGFDYYSPGGPSLKKYDAVNNILVGIIGTKIPIQTTEGLMTFIRGDRTANNLNAPTTPTILRTQGKLYLGTQADITAVAGEFTSIGNPYASPLDMRKVVTSNVDSTFYVWDPKLTGIGFGAYQSFQFIGNNFYPTPGFGSYGDPAVPYNYIQSGQAFFVHNSKASDGIVRFTESCKANADSPSVNNTLVFRAANTSSLQLFRTTLYNVNSNGSSDVLDGVLNIFGDDFKNIPDKEDGVKITNFYENLEIENNNKLLSIDRRHTINESDTIQLKLSQASIKQYKLTFTFSNFQQDVLTGYLEDRYLNTRTFLDLKNASDYNFEITQDTASQNEDRFRVIFNTATGALPIAFTSLKAYQQQKNIMIEWNVENAKDIKSYIIEKSVDGKSFSFLHTINSIDNNVTSNYQSLDESAVPGNNYYRIQSVFQNGETQYSAIINVVLSNDKPAIITTANPIVNDIINLQLINQPKDIFNIKLINNLGEVISVYILKHEAGSSFESIKINKAISYGIYFLKIEGSKNAYTFRLVK